MATPKKAAAKAAPKAGAKVAPKAAAKAAPKSAPVPIAAGVPDCVVKLQVTGNVTRLSIETRDEARASKDLDTAVVAPAVRQILVAFGIKL